MSGRGDGRVYRRRGSSRWWIQYSVRGRQFRESGGRTEAEARRKLRGRLHEAFGGSFVGPRADRVTVVELLDALVVHLRNKGIRSIDKLESHLKALRRHFALSRACDVTTARIEHFRSERLAAGKAPATVNRELEGLRQAFNHAAKSTPPLFPRDRVPAIPLQRLDNVRTGYFERAEVAALLATIPDCDVRDFVEWGFRTGMRKSEIGRLTWDMLDRSGSPWVLRIPGAIEKNATARSLGLEGEVRAIIERRLKARRLGCPLIFHRVAKGRSGQPVRDIAKMWRKALRDASLPDGRLFHDLRRSAVRILIRSGVDPSVAMKVSGHKTRSMLDRYNIIAETETATAFVKADAYLSTQQASPNAEEGHFGDSRSLACGQVPTRQQRVAEAGGNRTHRSGSDAGTERL